jgi:hypothetical protein
LSSFTRIEAIIAEAAAERPDRGVVYIIRLTTPRGRTILVIKKGQIEKVRKEN